LLEFENSGEGVSSSSRLKALQKMFTMDKKEALFVALTTILYIAFVLSGITQFIIIIGFILGSWYISRPSEWLYNGVNNLRIHMGLKEYLMGVLSAFAAIGAEIFIVTLSVYHAITGGLYELIEIAVLSTLFTMSFNILILGILAVKVEGIPVALTEDELIREMGIINWSMMASFLLVFMVITRVVFSDGLVANGNVFIPPMGAAMLPVSYMIYIYALGRKTKREKAMKAGTPTLTLKQAIIVTIGGVIGALAGSEMIITSSKLLLTINREAISVIGNPIIIISLIIGLAGAIHDLILNIFFTIKKQLSATVGNLIGTTIQMLLLLLGIVGIFVPIPLTDYITFELIVISFSLWFIRISISDRKIDDYDGALLITLQLLSFVLVLQGIFF